MFFFGLYCYSDSLFATVLRNVVVPWTVVVVLVCNTCL